MVKSPFTGCNQAVRAVYLLYLLGNVVFIVGQNQMQANAHLGVARCCQADKKCMNKWKTWAKNPLITKDSSSHGHAWGSICNLGDFWIRQVLESQMLFLLIQDMFSLFPAVSRREHYCRFFLYLTVLDLLFLQSPSWRLAQVQKMLLSSDGGKQWDRYFFIFHVIATINWSQAVVEMLLSSMHYLYIVVDK